MNQQNRQPDLHDEQAVIAAVQLLVRSMKPAQKEKLLSTLVHEQGETMLSDDAQPDRHVYADEVPLEAGMYPIQPLVLASDEGQHTSSESVAQTSSENGTDSSRAFSEEGTSERQQEERRPLETYAPFFLPLMSSLSHRQWWTRLALSAIFLFMLSLSTLVAYRAGVHAGVAMAPTASAPGTACQGRAYILQRAHPMHMRGQEVIISRDGQSPDQEPYITYVIGSGSALHWVQAPPAPAVIEWTTQCATDAPFRGLPHHHHNGD